MKDLHSEIKKIHVICRYFHEEGLFSWPSRTDQSTAKTSSDCYTGGIKLENPGQVFCVFLFWYVDIYTYTYLIYTYLSYDEKIFSNISCLKRTGIFCNISFIAKDLWAINVQYCTERPGNILVPRIFAYFMYRSWAHSITLWHSLNSVAQDIKFVVAILQVLKQSWSHWIFYHYLNYFFMIYSVLAKNLASK